LLSDIQESINIKRFVEEEKYLKNFDLADYSEKNDIADDHEVHPIQKFEVVNS